ncbi:MAG: hypothetical protein IJG32_07335 [Selenomonadaceae bacterium]|nr:hypothetical protein [Selenomonadaceae bacterium]
MQMTFEFNDGQRRELEIKKVTRAELDERIKETVDEFLKEKETADDE